MIGCRRVCIARSMSVLALSFFIVSWLSVSAGAQPMYSWQSNGVPVCVDPASQDQPNIASDGRGGAYVVWRDNRGADYDIYGQRLRQDGGILWAWFPDGMDICDATGDQGSVDPEKPIPLVQDGYGGFYTTWTDGRLANTRVYTQYVRLTSQTALDSNGVDMIAAQCYTNTIDDYPVIVPGSDPGQAIIVSHERCHSCGIARQLDNRVVAQKLDNVSGLEWGSGGTTAFGSCEINGYAWAFPDAAADGQGGACAAWADLHSWIYDIYAAKFNSSGVSGWGKLLVSGASGEQVNPRVVSNEAGGAIICWEDARSGKKEIYGQWLYANGTNRWVANGKLIASSAGNIQKISMCSDGAGGVFIVWEDASNSLDKDIFMHHVNIHGDTLTTRIPLCTASYNQGDPKIVQDGAGGAYVVWWDERDGFRDIYAQRVSADTVMWGTNGYPVCTSPFDQSFPQAALDTYNNGLLVTWVDWRNGNTDVYAQWLSDQEPTAVGDGASEFPPELAVNAYPNPFNPQTTIDFSIPVSASVSLKIYDVHGRLIDTLIDGPVTAGAYTATWDGKDSSGESIASGVYFVRLQAGQQLITRKIVSLK